MGVEQRRDSSSKETRNVNVLDGEPILSVEDLSDHQEDLPHVRISSQLVIGLGVEWGISWCWVVFMTLCV